MIMEKIIKSTDSLTEPPLTTASRRSLPSRGSREQRLTIFAEKNEVR